MAFWSDTYNNSSKDPKRGFKFKILFQGLAGGEPLIWWAKKVAKPSFDVTESKHSFSDKEYYFPGRLQWQTVSMTLVDPISPIDVVGQTNQLITNAGYEINNLDPNIKLVTMSKGKSVGSLGNVQIIQLDSAGEAVETWTLNNPFIKNVKYGELSYESDDLVEIELELRYDWASCDTQGGGATIGAGTNFTRN